MDPQIVHPWFNGGPAAIVDWKAASIDWCEPNYVVSPHVAEFWNTVTSFAMAAVAAYAFYWKRRQGLETRFLVTELAVIVIGLGSALFHGTLTFYGQLADELPMLYGAFVWVYVIMHHTRPRGVTDRWVVLGLTALAVGWTLISQAVHMHLNVVFEIVFGVIMLACMAQFLRLTLRSRSPHALFIFKVYVVMNVLAFAVWNLDQYFCQQLKGGLYLQLPYVASLHGYWHLGMSVAMYLGTLLIVMLRLEHLHGEPPELKWSLLPIIDPQWRAQKRTK